MICSICPMFVPFFPFYCAIYLVFVVKSGYLAGIDALGAFRQEEDSSYRTKASSFALASSSGTSKAVTFPTSTPDVLSDENRIANVAKQS